MVSLVFVVDILQLPHTVISNSEKLTHPTVESISGLQGPQYCFYLDTMRMKNADSVVPTGYGAKREI